MKQKYFTWRSPRRCCDSPAIGDCTYDRKRRQPPCRSRSRSLYTLRTPDLLLVSHLFSSNWRMSKLVTKSGARCHWWEERSQGVLKRMEVLELSQTMVGKWTRVGNWRNYFHSLGTFKLSSSQLPGPRQKFWVRN